MYSENKNYIDEILYSVSPDTQTAEKQNSIVELETLLRGSFQCRLSMKGLDKLSGLPKNTIDKLAGLFQHQSSHLEGYILKSKKDLWDFFQYIKRDRDIQKEYFNGKKHVLPNVSSNIKYTLSFIENILQDFQCADIKVVEISPGELVKIDTIIKEIGVLRSEYKRGEAFREKLQEHRACIAKTIDTAQIEKNESETPGLIARMRKFLGSFIHKNTTKDTSKISNNEGVENSDSQEPNIIIYPINKR